MVDDAPTGRDIQTVWKTIAYVGGALVSVGIFAALLISWGQGQSETNVVQTGDIRGLEKRFDGADKRMDRIEDSIGKRMNDIEATIEKRTDAIEREARFHERRGHGPMPPSASGRQR